MECTIVKTPAYDGTLRSSAVYKIVAFINLYYHTPSRTRRVVVACVPNVRCLLVKDAMNCIELSTKYVHCMVVSVEEVEEYAAFGLCLLSIIDCLSACVVLTIMLSRRRRLSMYLHTGNSRTWVKCTERGSRSE